MTRIDNHAIAAMTDDTNLVRLGRGEAYQACDTVNPPVWRGSTILFPTLAALEAAEAAPPAAHAPSSYGRQGTPTAAAFEAAMAALDGAFKGFALPSGMAAMAAAIIGFVKTGDHILAPDNVYAPFRRIANGVLRKMGVMVEYYPPLIGAGIAERLRPTTRLVYTEAPGSLTFEMPDIPAIAAAAHAGGAVVLMDNSWATPLFFKPLAHGVDVVIQAATKYIIGHSDALVGVITTTKDHWQTVNEAVRGLGYHTGPDDCYLALRGLRTMAVRLARHQETGLKLADWLADQPEVVRVLHPARPDDPGHALWRRDFSGASGLFAIALRPMPTAALAALVDSLSLFGMGYSWGGFESLILPVQPHKVRSATGWDETQRLLRIHAGLETPADLITDLAQGFVRMRAAL